MAKAIKSEISLVDEDGVEWVRAMLSPATIKRLVRMYEAQEIYLTPRERISA